MDIGCKIEEGVLIKYRGEESVVTIPEGVTKIRDKAFMDCKTITRIVMPDSVTRIGNSAFENCVKLKSMVCSKQLSEIGRKAFSGCKNLTELELPDTLKQVGALAFSGCTKLSKISSDSKVYEVKEEDPFCKIEECELLFDEKGFLIFNHALFSYKGNEEIIRIPEGVTYIHHKVFYSALYGNKLGIKKVVLPSSVKYVGQYAFANCTELETVEVCGEPEIEYNAFEGCTKLADEKGMLIVGGKLFSYFGEETIVEIPKGIERIADEVFDVGRFDSNPVNNKITKVILPEGLKEIGSRTFQGCISLEEINIPKSVEKIGYAAFEYCERLTKVEIPETAVIKDRAFYGCKNLADENGFIIINNFLFQCISQEEEIVVPEPVRFIGYAAFDGLKFKKITLPENLCSLGQSAFGVCSCLEEITLPEGMKKLPYGTFRNCSALRKVECSENMAEIGEDAFASCESLEEIRIPNVRKIEVNAFQNCGMLSKVTILNQNCDIALRAFRDCPKLTDEKGMKIVAGVLLAYEGMEPKVEIPDTVTKIERNVFREGREYLGKYHIDYRKELTLQEIFVAGSVRIISDSAFRNCKALKKVVLEEGIRQIGNLAFAECENLSEISIPSTVETLGEQVFWRCKNLQSVRIPGNVENIGPEAFANCDSLTDIFVEEGNSKYCDVDGVLYSADKKELLYYPKGKKSDRFVVPEFVEIIEDRAFLDCEEVKTIVIPASVRIIGRKVVFGDRNRYFQKTKLKDLQIALGAGSLGIGEEALILSDEEKPAVFPGVPILFPKEKMTQIRLALGFCQEPEKYKEEYAEGYRKFVKSNAKTLLKKASAMKLKKALAYLENMDNSNSVNGKIEKVNYKKLSETAKVELLERAVLEQNAGNLLQVIEGCGKFEFMSRALGLACLYTNVEIVKILVEHGARFTFEYTPTLKRKYGAAYGSSYNIYPAEYSLMIAATEADPYVPVMFAQAKEWHFGTLPEVDFHPAKEETRALIAEYLVTKECGFQQEDALFYAILWGCFPVAKKLMESGVKLTSYYRDVLCETGNSTQRNEMLVTLPELEPEVCAKSIGLFSACVEEEGKQLIFNPKIYEDRETSFLHPEVLRVLVAKTDTGKLSHSKILEMVLEKDDAAAVQVLAENGWIKTPAQREKLIKYATENQKKEALAWLMDYKNRTADVQAERKKEEAKMRRELMEDPNSVSALKKIWGYKKLEDGTLHITGYKGNDTKVTVPAKIGKSPVTSIGDYAFGVSYYKKNIVNKEIRKQITEVVLPEGITKIGMYAFGGCESLVSVSLPSTLTFIAAFGFERCKNLEKIELPEGIEHIGRGAFGGCKNLEKIELPEGIEHIGKEVFKGCSKLHRNEFLIINNILFDCSSNEEQLEIREGVEEIAEGALVLLNTKKLMFPSTLKVIGEYAVKAEKLESVVIPGSVKHIKKGAFSGCVRLKDISLSDGLEKIGNWAFSRTAIRNIIFPETVTELGEELFESCYSLSHISVPESVRKFGKECLGWGTIIIHTVEGSDAEQYVKDNYPRAVLRYDYGQESY